MKNCTMKSRKNRNVKKDKNDSQNIVRVFSRRTFSATVIVDKEKGLQIVGGTPVHSPDHTPGQTPFQSPTQSPFHTPAPSPPGSRSRATSYDMECYHILAKEYEAAGYVYFGDLKE